MTRSSTAKVAGVGAAVVFFAAAAFEASRILAGNPWHGIEPLYSHLVGAFLAALWSASAVACLVGRRDLAMVPILGAFALLTHFVVTRAGGSPVGVVYLAAVPVVVALTWLAFGREIHLRAPA